MVSNEQLYKGSMRDLRMICDDGVAGVAQGAIECAGACISATLGALPSFRMRGSFCLTQEKIDAVKYIHAKDRENAFGIQLKPMALMERPVVLGSCRLKMESSAKRGYREEYHHDCQRPRIHTCRGKSPIL